MECFGELFPHLGNNKKFSNQGNEEWINMFSRQIDQNTIPSLSGLTDMPHSPQQLVLTGHLHTNQMTIGKTVFL